MQIQIDSQVGVDDINSQAWKDFYESDAINEKTRNVLTHCSTASKAGVCVEDIVHDTDEATDEITGNARLKGPFFLATGRPNIVEPYTKRIFIKTIGGTQEAEHEATVFIEGEYSKGKGDSFALPSHEPIMILRDPPGGSSSASYENVKSTLRVVESETSTNLNANASIKPSVEFEPDAEFCAGGGFGAVVLACNGLVGGEVKVGVEVAAEIG